MIKVIVVDDEYLARQGMKKTVDWEMYGCEFCGEAEDGFEGIELAKKVKPDIIVTDIKMPGKTGIQMTEEIKVFLPDCKFIIITGYDDFQYAKAAIKVNAFDFILKPIDEGEFFSTIERAAKECIKLKEGLNITREKIILDLMRGKVENKNEILKNLKAYNIELKNIIIANMHNDSYDKMKAENDMHRYYCKNLLIINKLKNIFSENSYVIECHEDKFSLIYSTDGLVSSNVIHEKLIQFQHEIITKYNTTITIGVSESVSVLDIKKCYEQSKIALRSRMYEGKGSIIYFQELEQESSIKFHNIEEEKKKLILKIRACDRCGVEKTLYHIYYKILKNNKVDDYMVKQVSINILLSSLAILKEFNIADDKFEKDNINMYRTIDDLNTLNEIYSFVLRAVIDILDIIKEINAEAYDSGIKQALDYIRKNYSHDISLSDVAKKVYLSESYLSRKIKKTKGISFIEYLTKLRMEKAMEYLKNHNIKIAEIALKIGYTDYRYFSQIFKKYTGYSPSEWRENK